MRISAIRTFYRKQDLLFCVGLKGTPADYKMFRKLLSDEIAQKTGYDRKHTFTEVEKDIIIKYFKK